MTINGGDDRAAGGYSSPPCSMHEVDPDYMGLHPFPDASRPAEVMRWRKAERRRLIAQRQAIAAGDRRRRAQRIADSLDCLIGNPARLTIGAYWPFRGEPDLRDWMAEISRRGGRCALPVVIERGKPLLFRAYHPGARLEPGIWDIPIPAGGSEVTPEVVIAPVVGFDSACYRLGYGGGFFDRTLAAMTNFPRAFGVGDRLLAMPTIHPQPHDVAMDAIVTDDGIILPRRRPPDRSPLQRPGSALLKEIPDAVIFADRTGVIRFWNDGASRLFGYSPEEAAGKSLDIIIPERLRDRHWQGYRHRMEGGQPIHADDEIFSVPAETKAGARLSVQFTITLVRSDDREIVGAIAVLRDVTETYQELKRLRAKKQ